MLKKLGLSDKEIKFIEEQNKKYFKIYESLFEDFLNELKLPKDVENFYRAYFNDESSLKKYRERKIPLYTNRLNGLEK